MGCSHRNSGCRCASGALRAFSGNLSADCYSRHEAVNRREVEGLLAATLGPVVAVEAMVTPEVAEYLLHSPALEEGYKVSLVGCFADALHRTEVRDVLSGPCI
jgi:hypothetical protein